MTDIKTPIVVRGRWVAIPHGDRVWKLFALGADETSPSAPMDWVGDIRLAESDQKLEAIIQSLQSFCALIERGPD
jgi:hypothetical protein